MDFDYDEINRMLDNIWQLYSKIESVICTDGEEAANMLDQLESFVDKLNGIDPFTECTGIHQIKQFIADNRSVLAR